MTTLYYTEQEIIASIDKLTKDAQMRRELSLESLRHREGFIEDYILTLKRIDELEEMLREKQIEHAMKIAAL
jgi:hypothetical protein